MKISGRVSDESGKLYNFKAELNYSTGVCSWDMQPVVPMPDPRTRTLLGFSTEDSSAALSGGYYWTSLAQQFPRCRYWRTFNPPRSGAINWSARRNKALAEVAALTQQRFILHHSHKDWNLEDVKVAWNTMPDWVERLIWTYAHEPETDAAQHGFADPGVWNVQYWNRYQALRDLWESHPNRSRIWIAPTLTQYWAVYKGDWKIWAPIDASGQLLFHAIGFDVYAGVRKLNDPVEQMRIPLAAAKELGVPLVLGEIGAKVFGERALQGNPPSDAELARAQWIRGAVELLNREQVYGAAWFNNTSWRIDNDAPAAAAWGAGM